MYSLEETSGNKHEIIEYTANALKESGHSEIIENMRKHRNTMEIVG